MLRLIICLSMIGQLVACKTTEGPARANYKPLQNFQAESDDGKLYRVGDYVTQEVKDIGDDFYEVYRAEINPPDHWEGIRHSTYLFYEDIKLCRCSRADVAMSNDNNYITYPTEDRTGQMQINLITLEREAL